MASLLQKLLRKQSSCKTLIPNFTKQILPSSIHLADAKPESPVSTIPFFNGDCKSADESHPSPRSQVFYPCFSFEGFLNPISLTGFVRVEPEEGEEQIGSGGDDGIIWADSVKKKRKKKMNKHKLKKLRKRLRRKT